MILYVCTYGMSRSRTAEVLTQMGGLDARCCGISLEQAIVPINNRLIDNARQIICMEREHVNAVKEMAAYWGQPIESLGIQDIYNPFQEDLVDVLLAAMKFRDENIHRAMVAGRSHYLETHPRGFYVRKDHYASSMFGLGS